MLSLILAEQTLHSRKLEKSRVAINCGFFNKSKCWYLWLLFTKFFFMKNLFFLLFHPRVLDFFFFPPFLTRASEKHLNKRSYDVFSPVSTTKKRGTNSHLICRTAYDRICHWYQIFYIIISPKPRSLMCRLRCMIWWRRVWRQ